MKAQPLTIDQLKFIIAPFFLLLYSSIIFSPLTWGNVQTYKYKHKYKYFKSCNLYLLNCLTDKLP